MTIEMETLDILAQFHERIDFLERRINFIEGRVEALYDFTHPKSVLNAVWGNGDTAPNFKAEENIDPSLFDKMLLGEDIDQ